jgi:hypothetical protein
MRKMFPLTLLLAGLVLVTTSAGERKSMVWNMLRSQVFQFSLDERLRRCKSTVRVGC